MSSVRLLLVTEETRTLHLLGGILQFQSARHKIPNVRGSKGLRREGDVSKGLKGKCCFRGTVRGSRTKLEIGAPTAPRARKPGHHTCRINGFFGYGLNTVSGSTVSNTELSELFGSGLTEFRGANSVSSFQSIICVPKRIHRVFFAELTELAAELSEAQ